MNTFANMFLYREGKIPFVLFAQQLSKSLLLLVDGSHHTFDLAQ